MYTKDKSQRITLRLNEAQFNYVRYNAELLDVSPSDFLRMVINLSMSTDKKFAEKFQNALEGEIRRENENASVNNIV